MPFQISGDNQELAIEIMFGALTLFIFLAAAVVVNFALPKVLGVLTKRTRSSLDDSLVKCIKRPIFLLLITQGVFAGLTTISLLDRWQSAINKSWVIIAGIIVLYSIQLIMRTLLTWYSTEGSNGRGRTASAFTPLIGRFLTAAIYLLGGLLILDNVGVKVSPLLAGLGLGGLAIALALQPTLSSLIAGTYLIADGTVKVGDFVEVQDGPSGTVLDVGWRSSKLITPSNNVVVLPNSKFADSVVTNYMAQRGEVTIFPQCGVSYESDLQHVEDVVVDEARKLIRELPDTVVVKDYEPWFGFSEFGESNISFWITLKAKDRGSSFTVTHEIIKRIHARFMKEGIEINYPVRKLIYPTEVPKNELNGRPFR